MSIPHAFYPIFGTTTAVDNPLTATPSHLNLGEIFQSCPIIYTLLLILSLGASAIWLYTLLSLRQDELMPDSLLSQLRMMIQDKDYEEALETCQKNGTFCSKIIASALSTRQHGPQVMIEAMQNEGKRLGSVVWQRITLLNEIAVIAPMLGLLGTVLGLFFAFYDNSHTAESITSIFDGLGIAVGTTVMGLIVAILAMIFYTTLKYRAINLFNTVENESLSLVHLVDDER